MAALVGYQDAAEVRGERFPAPARDSPFSFDDVSPAAAPRRVAQTVSKTGPRGCATSALRVCAAMRSSAGEHQIGNNRASKTAAAS